MMADDLIVDPELQALIPALSSDERQTLEENIVLAGKCDPLKGWRETRKCVDGHNRYDICKKYDIAFEVEWLSFASEDEAKAWMIDYQMGRRSLTEFARARLALLKKPLLEAIAKAKMLAGVSPDPATHGLQGRGDRTERSTAGQLAKHSKTSSNTIRKTEKVLATATKGIIAAADSGKISVAKALGLAKLPKEEQAAALNDLLNAPKKLRGKKAAVKHSEEPASEGDAENGASKSTVSATEAITASMTKAGDGPAVEDEKRVKRLKDFLDVKRKAVSVDQLGWPLPDDGGVRVAFEGASDLDHAARLLGAIKSHMNRVGPAGSRLRGELDDRLSGAQNLLQAARPYATCTRCDGTGKVSDRACPACKGLKWLCLSDYETLAKEFQRGPNHATA